MINYIVIGGGSIGTRHLDNLRADGLPVAVVETDAAHRDHLAHTYPGVSIYAELDDALAGDINAALVCCPTGEHLVAAEAALNRGCHVFIEKPLSHNLDGTADLVKLAADASRVLFVGYNFRHQPVLAAIRALLHGGATGELLAVQVHAATHYEYRRHIHGWSNLMDDYIMRPVGGGVLLDGASHHIDTLQMFFGWPDDVSCQTAKLSPLPIAVEDTANLLLRYPGGKLANIHVSMVQKPYTVRYIFIAEGGTIEWDFAANAYRVFSADSGAWEEFPVTGDYNDTYVTEMRLFTDCIATGMTPVQDGAHARQILEIIDRFTP